MQKPHRLSSSIIAVLLVANGTSGKPGRQGNIEQVHLLQKHKAFARKVRSENDQLKKPTFQDGDVAFAYGIDLK